MINGNRWLQADLLAWAESELAVLNRKAAQWQKMSSGRASQSTGAASGRDE
jgi:hypothetical protein